MSPYAAQSSDNHWHLRFPQFTVRGWFILGLFMTVILPAVVLTVTYWRPLQRPVPVNITREQYNQALAKWQSKGITEYEEIADDFVTWKLHVRVVSGREEIIDFKKFSDFQWTSDGIATVKAVEGLPVGALFDDIARHFDINVLEELKEYGFFPYETVELDSELGYPKTISGHVWEEGGKCYDCGRRIIRVVSIKVLK